jgi:four helix bundle protein
LDESTALLVIGYWFFKGEAMKRDASRSFEGLEIYRQSEDLADTIWDLVIRWDNFARDTVGKQIVRCADGIGANVAEGTGRDTYADNRRFATMARGSLNETRHWLRRAFRRGLLNQREIDTLKPLLDQLPPRLNAYRNSIPRKPARQSRITNNQ